MNTSGIYKIESKIKPERIYIGSAVRIGHRLTNHLHDLRKNKHDNQRLQNHFNKYGESDLQFSVLLGCEKEDLIKIEQYFIDSYRPWFNILKIAGSTIGHETSEETRKKISIANKGNKYCLGRILSEESRRKMREAKLGKKRPESVRLKLLGRKSWNKGKKMSEECIEKNRRAQLGKKDSNETRKRKSEAQIRRRLNEREQLKIA